MRILIIIICFINVSCFSQTNKNRDIISATVKGIDSTSWNYILHLENKKTKIIVPVFKECDNGKDYLEKIKVGKKYSFVLSKEISYVRTQREFTSQSIDGKEIWNSDMKDTFYYTDCSNMCGLYIKLNKKNSPSLRSEFK
ncbi:hypothetical protein [Chryseobacterium geocarposphaerae]|uniref:Uncharacterized protein n=1 Tax=Chryseobacterium geocarposphaerae TaxID=1416776 RepID=A0A2M9C6B3_9FLAO|nr:hypothetical protein [Chryseobacterium geocarposphaerae]PJJ66397.1 hypothetical protein CLV73_0374 [Chryseobacterium geocarposphaerae]